ncbi:MAG TPA: beta-L-arabinofuranosidase domain-containing protein [Puia sp.]|uniref:beta-L-arabinofuranosidase domain-containing protein n=1 Tax=Puia sp. TaxID=2045100 RepID=UPI002CF3F697|nr:beta-L-arabinofuranosidase domain-containing protein [Puia sp.]HVU98637.1 beta-L-arabinofuranosidase domain-containing protein [Puia sp.]
MNFLRFGLTAGVCIAGLLAKAQTKADVVSRPSAKMVNTFYVSNRGPLKPLALVPLPVGSVQPRGWVRRYLELQRDGLTGKLGTISAWLDKKGNAWYSGNGQGDHGWEEVPYWLKGYGDLGYILNDPAIIAETKDWLEKVFASQQPDGWFGPRLGADGSRELKGGTPDLWPNMIMLWCMQSYYDYGHDPRVLPFMKRYFQWELTVPENELLKTYWENSRGGDNLYSIYWLYNHTGETWLLGLAERIHRHTADWTQKDRLPNWHNVNIAQCFREPAEYYMQTGDSAMLQATYHDFAFIRQLYGQVPGGMFGADENARKGHTDAHQAVETCGMVEQMASDELLTGITGDVFWADNCEDVAFNTYPAAVMPDFKALRYLTAPNMVVSDSSNHAPGIANDGPFLMMNPFSSRCCQHNHSQGWPYYAEHLWMATPDNGVAAVLYSAGSVRARVGAGKGGMVVVSERTHYPFDEAVEFTVDSVKGGGLAFPLYLRVPGWCTDATVTVNGADVPVRAVAGSWLRLERKWVAGDRVELRLPMSFTTRQWAANKNSESVNYGPLTFSLKIAESYKEMDGRQAAQGDSHWQAGADVSAWPSYEIFPASLWNYGLLPGEPFTITRRPWPKDDFPWTPGAAPIVIEAKGKLIPEWMLDKNGLCGVLPQSPVKASGPVESIELVPMGAARLRISAFPTVE